MRCDYFVSCFTQHTSAGAPKPLEVVVIKYLVYTFWHKDLMIEGHLDARWFQKFSDEHQRVWRKSR